MRPLISTNEYYLLVYETVHAAAAGVAADWDGGSAQNRAALWSKQLLCQVWYSKPGDIFLVLEEKKKQGNLLFKVLHGNRVGWIYSFGWIGLKEVKG